MAAQATSGGGAVRRVKTRSGRGGRPGVAAGRQKQSEWTGVRPRQGNRWAAEIRVPKTREKLWIGTFESDRLAARAYDAAVFCFYGENLPKTRRFNFPVAPHPDVPESMLGKLDANSVRAIAEQHAHAVEAALVPPPECAEAAPLVAAAAEVGPSAGAGATAPATSTTFHGVPTTMADNNLIASAADGDDSQFSFDPEVIAGLMGLVPGEF